MARRRRAEDRVVPGFVMRPSVSLAIPWICSCALWFHGILVTAKFTAAGTGERAAEGPISGLLSSPALVGVSIVNTLFLAALAADGRAAWKLQRCVGRSQLAGVLACVVILLLLQWCATLAHDPFLGR